MRFTPQPHLMIEALAETLSKAEIDKEGRDEAEQIARAIVAELFERKRHDGGLRSDLYETYRMLVRNLAPAEHNLRLDSANLTVFVRNGVVSPQELVGLSSQDILEGRFSHPQAV